MLPQLLCLLASSLLAHSAVLPRESNTTSAWSVSQFSSLVTFGDSYTDELRLDYFLQNAGAAPPPGTFFAEKFNTPGGGRTWPRYVVQYTGSEVDGAFNPQMTLYNYAVSGAVCSNELTPRYFKPINGIFPSVIDYEIPAFLADQSTVRNGTSEAYFRPGLTAEDAVYSMWIGTNDVGTGAFLTNSQVPGAILSDYTDCVFTALDSLYANGGRSFVLFNLAPLYLVPLYANDTEGGIGPSQAWPDKPDNHTAIAEKMKEYVTTLNNVYRFRLPFEVLIACRYPGAKFALFDVHSLLLDIHTTPTTYLNGTAPANVTGYEHHCSLDGATCYDTFNGSSPDSFMFYDPLHPSEQTDRVIAKEFVEVISGNSAYASYYKS